MLNRVILAFALSISPMAASAAPTLFNISGALDNGASVSGTIGIDTADGVADPVKSIDISGTAGTNRFPAFRTTILISAGKAQLFDYYQIVAGDGIVGPYINIRFYVATLAGFTGVGPCPSGTIDRTRCGFDLSVSEGSNGFLVNGSVTPLATRSAVPEPATWALLLCGFGLTGAALRRRNRIAVA